MLRLPVELQRQCIHHLDVASLKSLRLVGRAVLDLATEALFHTIIITPSNASTYEKILQHQTFPPLVRKVVFKTYDNDFPEDTYGSEDVDQAETVEALTEALDGIAFLPNFREVSLRFATACQGPNDSLYPETASETMEFREEVLALFFHMIKSIDKIDILTIENLQDHVKNEIYQSEDFKVTRSRLKSLHLLITTEHDEANPADDVNFDALHDFFNTHLFNYWLEPLQKQLTRLTLCSWTEPWGMWPTCNLRQVHFPHLKSLVLGRFSIFQDWQIDWITSHGGTVEELILDECHIVVAARLEQQQAMAIWPDTRANQAFDGQPGQPGRLGRTRVIERPTGRGDPYGRYMKESSLRWHSVISRLKTELPKLKNFALGESDRNEASVFEQRYQMPSKLLRRRYFMFDCSAPSQWIGGGRSGKRVRSHRFRVEGYEDMPFPDEECDTMDWETLVDLLETVDLRSCSNALV